MAKAASVGVVGTGGLAVVSQDMVARQRDTTRADVGIDPHMLVDMNKNEARGHKVHICPR